MIKVGDKVQTSADYARTLTTLRPYKGVVVDITDDVATTRLANGMLRYSDIAWLVKARRD